MEIELKEIRDFLASIPPFDRLPISCINELTYKTAIRYLRRGSPLPPKSLTENRLYILRKGVVIIHSKKGNLLGKLSDGDICTFFCTEGSHDKFVIDVEEDTLAYTIS